MVHQHFTSVPALSVAENVALAAGWPVHPSALRERVRALAERIGLPLEPDTPAGRLSVGLKQRLEIVKALATDVRILLLDEPPPCSRPVRRRSCFGWCGHSPREVDRPCSSPTSSTRRWVRRTG